MDVPSSAGKRRREPLKDGGRKDVSLVQRRNRSSQTLPAECKPQHTEQKRLFAALKKAEKAVVDHARKKNFNFETQQDRDDYFIKKAELKLKDRQAFLHAFPRLKEAEPSYSDLSKEEKRRLLEDEYIKTRNEIRMSKLVYNIMGCDS